MKKALYLSLLLLAAASTLFAAPAAERAFAPVQQGYAPAGEIVQAYATDHVLVQFTREAIRNSKLDFTANKSGVVTETGIRSVDAMAVRAGVKRYARSFRMPDNFAEASRLGTDRWYTLETDGRMDAREIVKSFAADPNVSSAQVDYRAFPAATPNDPMFADNWGHNNTAQLPDLDWGGTYDHTLPNTVGTPGFDANVQPAWDTTYGTSGVVIAIIDSGVDADHPDLRQVAGYDYGSGDSNPDDDSGQPGHGTACAGVAAAINNNGLGVAGAAGGCSIMPLKVANNQGSMYFSSIVDALYHAADNGADVISMSLGAPVTSDPATDAAIQYAYNAGCVILAATGNENMSVLGYPAINEYVIGVGAASPCGERKRSSSSSTECNPGVEPDPNGYTCDGERWWGSNYGPSTKDAAGAVDVIAPTILPTTDIQGSGGFASGDYSSFFNGTSCATPYAAGVCALIKTVNPTWTAAQIRDQLCDTAADVVSVESGSGWDRYTGYGMVDAAAAVGGGGPVENPPVAAFTGTPTSGELPLYVSFTDQSTENPTSWSWTFGDGGTSTAQNPGHTYTSAGVYTVTLTATNAYGSDGETKTNYITVTAPAAPVAAFVGTPTSGSYPLEVAFTDQSSGNPTSWSWTFGDGGTSTAQNPSHEYTAAGVYTVSLTATSAYGSDGETKTDYITVTEPGVTTFVTANGETSVVGSVSGTFANTAASDGVNQVITEVAYTGHPRKTYSYLEHRWSFDLPAGGEATFHLEASRSDNSDGDNMVFAYSTDGAIWTNLATVSSATEQSFNVPLGVLSGAVTVRVVDSDRTWGNSSMDSVNVDYMAFEMGDVQPTAPTADFAGTPTSGEYPLTVSFTDLSTGDPTGWSWTFGDGGVSTAQNPSHEYTAAGTYTVSLTASNAQGEDTATKIDYITVTEPGQGGSGAHVEDIVVSRVISGRKYYGRAVVTIFDDGGAAVSGATVTGVMTGDGTETLSGLTGPDGSVTLQTARKYYGTSEFCFEVTDVTHASLDYDSAANLVTKSCESGDIFSADETLLVTRFSLDQNAPNPFNPMTEIKFALPVEANVRLVIYNLKGEVVETLIDGTRGRGIHTATWDARDQASGVYFYRLEAGNYTQTRKMIMLK